MNRSSMAAAPVKVTLYRWGGQWGPFKVSIPCGECSLTRDVISDTFETELAGVPVAFETVDWLSNWWKPLSKGLRWLDTMVQSNLLNSIGTRPC